MAGAHSLRPCPGSQTRRTCAAKRPLCAGTRARRQTHLAYKAANVANAGCHARTSSGQSGHMQHPTRSTGTRQHDHAAAGRPTRSRLLGLPWCRRAHARHPTAGLWAARAAPCAVGARVERKEVDVRQQRVQIGGAERARAGGALLGRRAGRGRDDRHQLLPLWRSSAVSGISGGTSASGAGATAGAAAAPRACGGAPWRASRRQRGERPERAVSAGAPPAQLRLTPLQARARTGASAPALAKLRGQCRSGRKQPHPNRCCRHARNKAPLSSHQPPAPLGMQRGAHRCKEAEHRRARARLRQRARPLRQALQHLLPRHPHGRKDVR